MYSICYFICLLYLIHDIHIIAGVNIKSLLIIHKKIFRLSYSLEINESEDIKFAKENSSIKFDNTTINSLLLHISF
jgi:hypothetical protein